MNLFRRATSDLSAETIVYGVLAFVSSLWVAGELQRYGLDPFSFYALPIFCVLLIASRWNVFEALIHAALFTGVISIVLIGQDIESASSQIWFAVGALVLVAAVARFQSSSKKEERLLATSRLNYTPVQRDITSAKASFHISKITTLALILIAWVSAGIACRRLTAITADRQAYEEYFDRVRANIGLDVPEVFIGMKLLFAMALVSWIVRGLFSYFCFAQGGEGLAAMHLRSELWRWNGSEQRMISKQLRKNQI